MTNSSKSCIGHEDSARNEVSCRKRTCKDASSCRKFYENNIPSAIRQSNMYQAFQNWAIQNYGDRGKTKTVTRNKWQKIVKILKGEEEFTAENSKFRFWVKAKGFQLSSDVGEFGMDVLLVPSRHGNDEDGQSIKAFRRVAVVENFFDIIYNVHVDMGGRAGKHAGQKRTYKAVAETFSFLPREAVTRFLMSCTDCQKRMQMSVEFNSNSPSAEDSSNLTQESESSNCAMSRNGSPSIGHAAGPGESTESGECITNLKDNSGNSNNNNNTEIKKEELQDMTSAKRASPPTMDTENRATDSSPECALSRKASPIPGKVAVGKGHPERKRRASSESGDSAMTKTSDGKDDEDEDDNDDDEKLPVGLNIDPEKLKAFNMFVRLFVDENLDRMVPISKQPKDKIQAILEACDRQFPEFNERSRKRLRTYLKSCRRMRRSKEQNGWEPLRPTPPHLTSAAAEGLLASACENESQNAKRMRLGLEPLPASAMVSHNSVAPSQTPTNIQPSIPAQPQTAVTQIASQPKSMTSPVNCSASSDFLRHQQPASTFRPAQGLTTSFFTNGHGAAALFRPGFPSYQHPAHHQHPAVLPHAPVAASATTNGDFGPTDLSIKKTSNKGQLSSSEVTAIKQLIAGYRESAAFLYRSADELEQLLLQQN